MAECLIDESLAHKRPDVVFVRPKQAEMLHSGPAKIVKTALIEINTIIEQLVQCRSKSEFVEMRKKVFADYANLQYIIANSFSIGDQGDKAAGALRSVAIQQALKGEREFFKTEGTPSLGAEIIREAVFCLDTLRRAYRLVHVIRTLGDAPASLQAQDYKLSGSFSNTALWAQLHVDSLALIIRGRTGQDAEVLDEILLSARAAVMAYSFVRQGIELRTSRESGLLGAEEQDVEDKELLEESFSDYVHYESRIDAES